MKRIGVDHELACALWDTGRYDARILAVKVADPTRVTEGELDRWVDGATGRMVIGYVAMLAGESPHAATTAARWARSTHPVQAAAAWSLVAQLAVRDTDSPDVVFLAHLAAIEAAIHTAPNAQRETMNMAVIQIGGRNAALRRSAIETAARIGAVDVDHGDTACETPDAAAYIAKTWAHSLAKGFESPAAHERSREPQRRRC